MAIYKKTKNGRKSRVYWMEFVFKGQRIQRSTRQRNRRDAREVESAYRAALGKGEFGVLEQERIPKLSSISPSSATVGSQEFILTVTGANFGHDSVVRWNSSPRKTVYVSPTQLTTAILAADVATPGTAMITVFTPKPGGYIGDPRVHN